MNFKQLLFFAFFLVAFSVKAQTLPISVDKGQPLTMPTFNPDNKVKLRFDNAQSGVHLGIMNYRTLEEVQSFKKFEIGVELPKWLIEQINLYVVYQVPGNEGINPFMEWDIDVECTFIHVQSQTTKVIDGFYYREYKENSQTDDWDDIGTMYPFRIRFAPHLIGDWEAHVSVKLRDGKVLFGSDFQFHVVDSGSKGFTSVHPNKKNLVRGGEIVFPVGHNLTSPEDHDLEWGGSADFLGRNLFSPANTTKAANTQIWDFHHQKVESYLKRGGKYIRLTQTAWSSLIEFEQKGNYYHRLHYAWEQDRLIELLEKYDAQAQFNMLFHTVVCEYDAYDISNWDWEKWKKVDDGNGGVKVVYLQNDPMPVYCYNNRPAKSGGKKVHEALSNEDDLRYHEQRTRYYISRYGYSTSIYQFELLSEPFNVGLNGITKAQPYFTGSQEEKQELYRSIEKYHSTLSAYIKGKMKHTNQVIGVDYSGGLWKPNVEDIEMDLSYLDPNIDVIAFNYYSSLPQKYLIANIGEKNNYNVGENSRANEYATFQKMAQKPVLLSELGDGDGVTTCSQYVGNRIDVMAMPFSNVGGVFLWHGREAAASHIWEPTIASEKHMNRKEIVTLLGINDGQWIQGRQKTSVSSRGGDIVEQQYYLSADGKMVAGYVRNRTANAFTYWDSLERRCANQPTIVVEDAYKIRTDVSGADLRGKRRLIVYGVNNKMQYKIRWFKTSDGKELSEEFVQIQKAKRRQLILDFPTLNVTDIGNETPAFWYIIEEIK